MENDIANVLREQPGLTGRQIAKVLGVTKKEVNSFLHHDDSGRFSATDNHWSLEESGVQICFDQDRWLVASKFEELLCASPDLWDADKDLITFRFVNCNILLDAISRILALVNQLASEGKQVTLDFSQCKESFGYLCRVGLFEVIDPRIVVVPEVKDCSEHYGQNNKVMEFVSIAPNTTETDLPSKLKTAFVNLAGDKHANAAFAFMSEFVNNIIEHSNTPVAGFAALQVYGGQRKKIQTVFSDSGDGIIGTLRPVLKERYPSLYNKYPQNIPSDNAKLLKEVFEFGGVSGANDTEYEGRGLGLKVSAKTASKFDATIRIRQANFELELGYSGGKMNTDKVFYDLNKLNGTHICFDFYLE